jgi:hypothetical protein
MIGAACLLSSSSLLVLVHSAVEANMFIPLQCRSQIGWRRWTSCFAEGATSTINWLPTMNCSTISSTTLKESVSEVDFLLAPTRRSATHFPLFWCDCDGVSVAPFYIICRHRHLFGSSGQFAITFSSHRVAGACSNVEKEGAECPTYSTGHTC